MNKIIGHSIEDLRQLAEIVNEYELSEITLSDNDGREITIKGKRTAEYIQPTTVPVQTTVVTTDSVAVEAQPAGHVIKSPILGTFYASASPDEEPYVKVGQNVKKGDVLYIVETMKVMNEIKSEYAGTVTEIFVNDTEPLEYDQPIMIIE
ncbi:MAG: acetyl-CoA carboxylase biotin carboxyl carrier protein [Clostridiales bacterium]|nr:acetyl-CoA carboxylase biotin carboxyl carrier protein [Clostridiales bacterium]